MGVLGGKHPEVANLLTVGVSERSCTKDEDGGLGETNFDAETTSTGIDILERSKLNRELEGAAMATAVRLLELGCSLLFCHVEIDIFAIVWTDTEGKTCFYLHTTEPPPTLRYEHMPRSQRKIPMTNDSLLQKLPAASTYRASFPPCAATKCSERAQYQHQFDGIHMFLSVTGEMPTGQVNGLTWHVLLCPQRRHADATRAHVVSCSSYRWCRIQAKSGHPAAI